MIHIEVQSDKDTDFPRRMYVYNYRIFDKQYRPVTSLAILADEVSSWRPAGYTSEQWGCKINFEFPMVKIMDYADDAAGWVNKTIYTKPDCLRGGKENAICNKCRENRDRKRQR